MNKYTLKDFDNFERTGGMIICPSGDYTQIRNFPMFCTFGEGSSFGKCCSFGEWSSLGKWSSFGKFCSFGEGCSFGERSSFGENCKYIDFTFNEIKQLQIFDYPIRIYINENNYFLSIGCKNYASFYDIPKSEKDRYPVEAKILKLVLDEYFGE